MFREFIFFNKYQFTPSALYSRLVCFTNPFLHSFLVPFKLLSRIFDLYQTRWALAFLFVLVSSFKIMFLVTCARLSWLGLHLAFQSTLNSCIVSYCSSQSAAVYLFFFGVLFTLHTCRLPVPYGRQSTTKSNIKMFQDASKTLLTSFVAMPTLHTVQRFLDSLRNCLFPASSTRVKFDRRLFSFDIKQGEVRMCCGSHLCWRGQGC